MKVLYILGAGASWQCIPTYTDFNTSLIKFILLFEESHKDLGLSSILKKVGVNKEQVYNLIEIYKKHANECSYFGTPDTYAVSLRENKKELDELKKLVSAFLFFMQVDPDEDLFQRFKINTYYYYELYKPLNKNRNVGGEFRVTLDRRYISLFSSLITKHDGKIPNDVAFITWNYDFQVEKALKLFITPSIANDFVKENIVQLNGSCKYRQNMSIPNRKITEEDLEKLVAFLFDPSDSKSLQLNFSWEKKTDKRVEKLVMDCDCVVLIGYSVPDYNRLSDTLLFSQIAVSNKKVYIQDINPDSVRKRLASINNEHFNVLHNKEYVEGNLVSTKEARFELVSDTLQFLIPGEYWKKNI